MLACLLAQVQGALAGAARRRRNLLPALQQAVDAVFDARIGDISDTRLGADMREIWMIRSRGSSGASASQTSLVEGPRYRAGWDFLRLRADAGRSRQRRAGRVVGGLRADPDGTARR